MNSSVHTWKGACVACMQMLPNLSAFRTSGQGATDSGGFQRLVLTGGAANGIPLKTMIDASRPAVPETGPESMRTGSAILNGPLVCPASIPASPPLAPAFPSVPMPPDPVPPTLDPPTLDPPTLDPPTLDPPTLDPPTPEPLLPGPLPPEPLLPAAA